MTAVRVGIKRHRVDLQRAAKTQSDTGDLVKTWATFGRVWADVNPLRGEELTLQQQLKATTTHRVRLRRTPASATLTPADRVKWGGRIFEIETVVDVGERRREMELMAREFIA